MSLLPPIVVFESHFWRRARAEGDSGVVPEVSTTLSLLFLYLLCSGGDGAF